MIEYRIIVKNSSGDNLGEFATFRNLKFGKKLNNYGQCTFDVPINDPTVASLIALRRNTVWIYRNDVLIWAGEQASRIGSLDDKGDNWVTVYCYDWFEQLASRYTGSSKVFTGVDAGEIAWTLINDSQGLTDGDLGITEGTIEATQNRDRTYYNQNIADAITNLSNVINGFDFEINNSRVFNVYTFIGVDRSDSIILEYGVNIKSIKITEDFSKPVNQAIILGDSGDPLDPLRVERVDAALRALYKLREGLSNESTVSEPATLNDKGDAIIQKYGLPLVKVSMDIVRLTPTIVDFALGDIIRLKVQSGLYDIDDQYRIFEWQVDYGADNTEKLTLVLGDFNIPEFS
jgi:hypothetical protein